MGKVAFLFPGQGSQSVGMGKDIYNNYQAAKNVFDKAKQVIGKDISKLCFEGTEDELKQTINSQPAIVTTSIAILEALRAQLDIQPHYVAGHSLGEYCAMYTSGVMDLETTLKAIQKRASLMNEVKGGTMSAVLNAPFGSVEKALNEASEIGYVDVANYNSPAQVVLTGEEAAVKKAGELLLEAGAKRVVPLAVSGAFHSKFLAGASKEFANYVSDLDLASAFVPVVTNVDGAATISAEDFRNKMPRQICSSVHWTQTIENMIKNGVNIFVEIGPGKVLAGLNQKINSEVTTYNVYDSKSLEDTVSLLKEELALI